VTGKTSRSSAALVPLVSLCPPMFIFAGKRRKIEWSTDAPADATFAVTDSSNIQGHLFMAWMRWFVSSVGPARSQLLLLDGHFAHLGHDVLVFAKANGIDVFVLPAHTSHFLQPCDGAPFAVFKRAMEQAVSDFPLHHKGRLPTRDDLPALAQEPWNKAMTPSNIIGAFAKCGIYPLSADAMAAGVVGIAPVLPKPLPHIQAAVEHIKPLFVSKRLDNAWQVKGVDKDAVQVAYRCIDRFLGTFEATTQPRTGTFVPEAAAKTLTDGGLLITHDDMLALVENQALARDQKRQDVEARKQRRIEVKALKLALNQSKPGRMKQGGTTKLLREDSLSALLAGEIAET